MRPLRYLNGRTLSPVPAEARQRARVLRLKTGRATQQEKKEPKAKDLQGMPPKAGGVHGCSHVPLLARRIQLFKQVSFHTNSEASTHAVAPPLSAARALADGPALAGPGEIPRPDQHRRASE